MPSPPERPTAGYLLWRVTNKWRAAVDRVLAPIGLTHAQYSVLASLYGQSRTGARPSQRELADVAGLEPIYVSKLVRALAQAGIVVRATHPGDPRAVQLTLTEHGTETAERAIAIVRALQEEVTAPIGGTKSRRHRELVRMLQTLLADENRSEAVTQTPTLSGQDIGEAQGAVRALLDDTLAKTDISSDEYIVLRVLALRGAAGSPTALRDFLAGQRQLGLDHAGVTELLQGLQTRGLITGAPDGPGPTRLTESGSARYADLADMVAQVTRRLYGDIDQEDLATAHRVLREVVDRAGRLREELR
jgi:DNA-binding MarR family transcriptional regulator